MKSKLLFWILLFGLAMPLTIILALIAPIARADGPKFHPPSSGRLAVATVTPGEPGLSFRYAETFGITGEAYTTTTAYLNSPAGLFIDTDDSLYVVEYKGDRMLKYNAAGQRVLTIGEAGVPVDDGDTKDNLSAPQDVATDRNNHIWITVDNALKEFDTSGKLLQIFPPENYWAWGTGNNQFKNPRGIAFDSAGRLYVADKNNHRVQVFTFTTAITLPQPVYSATIGVTGVATVTNAGFSSPYQIAFDSSNRMYVSDNGNHRIQRCQYTGGGWQCSTFLGIGGVYGSDLTHLFYPTGIFIDSSDNIYIADSGNYRVLKCSLAGTCSLFAGVSGEQGNDNNHFQYPFDIALDSTANVYISDYGNHRVQKYANDGTYLQTIGSTNQPYITDTIRFNNPQSVTATPDEGLLVIENGGYRVIKLNAAGERQWTIGQAGVYGNDNAHFGNWWASLEGVPAIDRNGRIYIADTGNNRIQIFDENGQYLATLGSSGNGPKQFSCPAGVAINPVNEDIYILDKCHQRIQVLASDLTYKGQIGETDVHGTDNEHFSDPWGIAISSNGTVFVADSGNHRVQKCVFHNPGYTCTTFAGETSVYASDFAHLHPLAVAIDAEDRVYVADEWNIRIQVFDTNGAYLTTIGGRWGDDVNEMNSPSGVAVDAAGNVYVADRLNQRIKKYVPGVPNWKQTNINGFGDFNNRWITQLSKYQGYLYAAVANHTSGCEIWRTADGTHWQQVNTGGFGDTDNTTIYGMVEFGNNFYVGTLNETDGGEIWRCQQCDGSDWVRVSAAGFGDIHNSDTQPGVVLGGYLYADTGNKSTGCEIWRTADGTHWEQINTDGFGNAQNWACSVEVVFKNWLYIGTYNDQSGGELWRFDGTDWMRIGASGFGDANNQSLVPLIANDGYLYIGAWNETTGVEVWRSTDGLGWNQVNTDGFGNSNNTGVFDFSAAVFNNELYISVNNQPEGLEIWKTKQGTTWQQVMAGGFGDKNNNEAPEPLLVFNNQLYASASNPVNGVKIWQFTAEDAYEPDDNCPQANLLATNGIPQSHNFHNQGDTDWAKFNVISGTTYVLQATATGPDADLALELYDGCSGNLSGGDDNAFSADARLVFTAPADGTYYAKVFNADTTSYGTDVTYELSVRTQSPGGVVLIVAGHDDNYRLQNNILYATNFAYRTFLNSGIPKSHIRYLSTINDSRTDADGDGISDVYASSASANVYNALTVWAANLADSRTPFYLYLMDHGGVDVFLSNGNSDRISATQLDTWLATLESATGTPVSVIYEACQSGSFIDGDEEISRSGRVVIASTGRQNNAYPTPGRGAIFSDAFFTGLGQSLDLYTAFQWGTAAVQASGLWQTPWLDDNGNAVPNDDTDGKIAAGRGLANFAFSGERPPVIDAIRSPVIGENGEGTLRVEVRDDTGIAKVWTEIYTPSFVEPAPAADGTIPDLNLPEVTLSDSNGDGVYIGVYEGFTTDGDYRLVTYAEDNAGNLSQPSVYTVTVGQTMVYLPLILRN